MAYIFLTSFRPVVNPNRSSLKLNSFKETLKIFPFLSLQATVPFLAKDIFFLTDNLLAGFKLPNGLKQMFEFVKS